MHAPMVRRGMHAGAAVSMWFNANKCDVHSLGVAGVRLASLNCALGVYFPLYLRHSWSENRVLQYFTKSCSCEKTHFAVFYSILLHAETWSN